jgi:hypothetical protein
MGMPMTRILTSLALVVACGLEAQAPTNPVLRRRSLPARVGPDALSGHDRADLRRDWDLYWFGGKLTPDYMDFKNRAAAEEIRKWGHLLPKAGTDRALTAILPTPSGTGGFSWTNLGPTSNLVDATWSGIDSGRPVAVVPHPTTATTLYLATSGGGVFKCTNADLNAAGDWTWTAITDDLPASGSGGNVSIGAMAMSPTDANVLYVGLGDPFDAEGRGFYKTPDGGTTWTAATAGLGNATRSHSILPLSATRILWATNDGLKISNDGGATFAPAAGAPATGDAWSIQKFTGTDLACSLQGTAGQIYASADAGATWTLATITGVTFPMGRITLAAGGDGTTAYGIVEDTTASSTKVARGVLKSTDKGLTWTWVAAPTAIGGLFQGTGPQMTSDGGQGWYNHGLAVDPTNPLRIVVGSNLALYRSTDGGTSWTQLTHWYGNGHPYTHADNHATAWSNGTLYVANDGGLAILRDPWRATVPTATDDLSFIDNRRNKGLSTHMVYNLGSTTAATPSNAKWRVTLGMQDNGTRVRQGSGSALQTSGVFEDMIGGDGFGTLIHPANGDLMLGSIYYTRIYKSTDGGATPFTASSTGISESNNSSSAPFAPKIALGPTTSPDTVYTFVNSKVYKSTDFGSNWSAMTMTGFSASGRTLRNVNGSRSSNAVGAASSGGHFWTTYNDGATWTDSGDITAGKLNTSYIWFNTQNDQIVYGATVAPDATAHHLFKSVNGGATWAAIDGAAGASNGLPFGIPVHVVQNLPGSLNTLFAGTDFGVYQSTDGGTTWARYGNNLPMVAVRDLYIAPDGSFLRAATYGRGVWELQTTTANQTTVTLDKTSFNLNPSATTTFTATVTNFTADNKVNWTASSGGAVSPAQTASGSATTYTASATPGIYTVTAASNELATATATATVNVYTPAAVTVSVTPATKTLPTGGTFTFAAAVANAPSQAVTWTASGGAITSAGAYTAPATAGTYTITATSVWPGTTTGTATVTVTTMDLNGDGVVDLRDLLFFAKYYGSTNAACDFNGDGKVDDADLTLLLAGL